MTRVKSRIAIAISTGLIISMLFTAYNGPLGNTAFRFLLFLGTPGYLTIGLLWGFHGSSAPDFVVLIVMTAVNAAVLSLIAYGVLRLFYR